jgi:hypothetical protein
VAVQYFVSIFVVKIATFARLSRTTSQQRLGVKPEQIVL